MKENMGFLPPLAIFIIFFNLTFPSGWAKLIYEDGYTVTTVFDGDKLNINPQSLSHRPGFNDLVLLDSSNSRFYIRSLPLSQETVFKKFAGEGLAGFSDGDAFTAMFDKPRNFAVDLKGNVYVADRRNFAVRKISKSGTVVTIAGGYSKRPGHADGPGKNATFSQDYELTFVPDMCALLISDHGSRLIRQINLKREDCVRSESGVGVNVVWPWAVAVVVSCVVGLLTGFIVRPYIMPHGEFKFNEINKSWRRYIMNLGRQTRMHCYGTRSAVASSALNFMSGVVIMVLSHLYLLLAFVFKRVDSSSSNVDNVSLLDSDFSLSSCCVSSNKYDEQLRGLISFGGDSVASEVCNDILMEEERDEDQHGSINDLVQANIAKFASDACKCCALEGPFLGVSTVVKRR